MRYGADHILLYGFCTTTALYIRTIGEIMLMPIEKNKTKKKQPNMLILLFKHEISSCNHNNLMLGSFLHTSCFEFPTLS